MKNKAIIKETSGEKFKRLATQRTKAVLKRLQILGNCANRYVYDYDEADVEKIFSEIERYTRNIKAKYKLPRKESEFKL